MKVRPLGDFCLVLPHYEKHNGLLVIKDKLMTIGTVLNKGDKVKNIEVGQVVWFSSFVGQKINRDKEDSMLMIRELEIAGIVEDVEPQYPVENK